MGAENYLCLVRFQYQLAFLFSSSIVFFFDCFLLRLFSSSTVFFFDSSFNIANVHPSGKGSKIARSHRSQPKSLRKSSNKCAVDFIRPSPLR
jgi:hypothetical protein